MFQSGHRNYAQNTASNEPFRFGEDNWTYVNLAFMLPKSYFDRTPDEGLIVDQGKRYDYIAATRGKDYAFFYDYTGRNFKVNMGKVKGTEVKAIWYCPIDGSKKLIGFFVNKGVQSFDPPGEEKDGNDWVLILEKFKGLLRK